MDMGDFVVVINAEKVVVSGQKPAQKMYYRHSNYPGGFRDPLPGSHPAPPHRPAGSRCAGMLPRGPLGDNLYRKLHAYAGPMHQHQAQQPQPWPMDTVAEETGQHR